MYFSTATIATIISAATIASTQAFSPAASSTNPARLSMSHLRASSLDVETEKLIDKALETTNKHGATSLEARLAWEAVEELKSLEEKR